MVRLDKEALANSIAAPGARLLESATYRDAPELSYSGMRQLLENPYAYFHGITKEATKSMDLGTAAHKLVLESNWAKQVTNEGQAIAIMPKFGPQNVKANKEAKAHWMAANVDSYIVDGEAYACAEAVIKSQYGSYFTSENSICEVPIARSLTFENFDGEEVTMDFKMKADCIVLENGAPHSIIDLKTASASDESSFINSVAKGRYYLQAFIYKQILGIENFFFVCVENTYPYMIGVYSLDPAWDDLAKSDLAMVEYLLKNKERFVDNVRVMPYRSEEGQGLTICKCVRPPAWLFHKHENNIS